MECGPSGEQSELNDEYQTYSAANNEQRHIYKQDDSENDHEVGEALQGSREQPLPPRIANSFSNQRILTTLAFVCLILAASKIFLQIHVDPKTPDDPSNIEISHGSVCEKHFDQVKKLLDESFQTKIRFAAEKLDQIEPDIEKHCLPSKKGVNLEIYFKMGFIYFRANMSSKFLKWLCKIEKILKYNQGAPLDSETVMKTFLILATWSIQQGEYVQAETRIERAKEAFEEYQKGENKDPAYLESWLKEVLAEFNLAKYVSSNDQTGRVHFYKMAELFYIEAINLRETLKKFRIAGSAQCMLASLYIEAREFEKAEQMNNEGAKNIKRSTEKIYTMAFCIKNDALIKLRRGQVPAAQVRFQEALSLLEEVLPQGNDLILRYRKEFSKIFSTKL